MPEKVILDPSHRRLSNIFTDADLARVCAAADIVWAKDEPMPEVEVAKVRDDVVAIITGGWRYGDVARFPNLRAVLEVSGGFPSPTLLDYRTCFSRSIRVLSCAPAFGPMVAGWRVRSNRCSSPLTARSKSTTPG